MNTNKLKLVIAILSIALFASCKSVESENKSTSQKRQGGQPNVTQLIAQMDANKDGKLSTSEVKGPLKTDFSKIDTDNDGFLSEAELEKAPKPERRKGQGQGRPQGRN